MFDVEVSVPLLTRVLVLTGLCLASVAPTAWAQGASTWFLAEGANNSNFVEDILIGNPGPNNVTVTVTLLPQSDAVTPTLVKTFGMPPTSRLTVNLSQDFKLNGSSSARVSAVKSGTSTPADIVVERTMYFGGALRADRLPGGKAPGAHNASGVTATASRWVLAEGATGAFETFVLVANPNPSATRVRATCLTGTGQVLVSEQEAAAQGRVTFWPRAEHPALASAEFSTEIESLTTGNGVVAERAMYFDGLRSGHDALGVTAASTTWHFAEGFTGGNAATAFETFLLLANTGAAESRVTVDYLLDTGGVVSRTYTVPARQRFTVWVDNEGRTSDTRLAASAFGIRITASTPIVAERAMYWGTPSAGDPTTPRFPWVEGHATAGITAPASKWAFAEGQQGAWGNWNPEVLDPPGYTRYHSFFLLANPQDAPITVQATFANENDEVFYHPGGSVRQLCLPAHSRVTVWAANYPELAGEFWYYTDYDYWVPGRKFSTFLESVANVDPACPSTAGTGFVAERAMYYGEGFAGGHVNAGTPWTGSIAPPPGKGRVPAEADNPACTYTVSPTSLTFPATFAVNSEKSQIVTVTTTPECRWSTQVSPEVGGWFTAVPTGSDTGSGTARVGVWGSNTTTAAYTGWVKVAGQVVTITQRGK